MMDVLQTILLVFIAWFIVSQKTGKLTGFFGKKEAGIILDSCALIDGRIVEIVSSGFVKDELVIPQFILNELQLLADGSDSHKRERARFGLDIAHQLQDAAPNPVTIDRSVFTETKAVDDMLVLLAKKLNARLYTTDYNLGKVAAVEGVQVLNVNDLAQRLRPITLPGETLDIKIIQRGSNRDQGVGYLEDGTMIVVDGAIKHVGKTVPVTVTRMHQTVAGKMVFGQVHAPSRNGGNQAKQRSDGHLPDSESSDGAGAAQPQMIRGAGKRPPALGVSNASDVQNSQTKKLPRTRTTSGQGRLHNRLKTLRRRRPTIQ